MTKKPSRLSFATLEADKLVAICNALQGDGHGIYKESTFVDLGIPAEIIEPISYSYKSDTRDHKSTIFAPGGIVVEEMRGVYSLRLYETIAQDLGLPGSNTSGLGFRAQECHEQIMEWCCNRLASKPPVCHEREMCDVKNENGAPIWWCPDCGRKTDRTENATT